eukprot:6130106-Pleurochrysis_carterae.AAC.2
MRPGCKQSRCELFTARTWSASRKSPTLRAATQRHRTRPSGTKSKLHEELTAGSASAASTSTDKTGVDERSAERHTAGCETAADHAVPHLPMDGGAAAHAAKIAAACGWKTARTMRALGSTRQAREICDMGPITRSR